MALTKVSPSLFQVSNNITSVTVGGSANTISLTFDSNGVITGASNNAVSVANTAITGNIISSQITSVANTQITGNIISSQITSNPTFYGNVSVTGVIGVGGATPTTNGSGITFPASQSASTNANTLDDYEEGVFTTTLSKGTSGTITVNPSYNTFSYTKIGRVVHINGHVRISAVSSPVGNIIITLPFVSGNTSTDRNRAGGAVSYYTGTSPYYYVHGWLISENSSNLQIQIANGIRTPTTTDEISLSLLYMTAT